MIRGKFQEALPVRDGFRRGAKVLLLHHPRIEVGFRVIRVDLQEGLELLEGLGGGIAF